MNETIWLPRDPNYRTSGNVAPMRNPNYGRPFILTKASPRIYDSQRAAGRFTGFVKHDFAEKLKRGSWLGQVLGRHTLTGLADRSTFDEKQVAFNLTSFGDPEPALHIGPANARQTSNAPRNVPLMTYIGPPQLQAFTDPNFKFSDFVLTPAKYQLRLPADYSIRKLTWNLGPDATAATLGLDSRANGNEGFVFGTFTPREMPNKNYRLQQTIANMGARPPALKKTLDEWYPRDVQGRPFIKVPERFGDPMFHVRNFTGRPARPEPVRGVVQGIELVQYDLTPEQYAALTKLTAALCKVFPKIACDYPRDAAGRLIPEKLPEDDLKNYRGVLGHYHIQSNKTDPGPAFDWDRVISGARRVLDLSKVPPGASDIGPGMIAR